MIQIFITHLKALLYDLQAENSEDSWPSGAIGDFVHILLLLLQEVISALETFFCTQDVEQLHRGLIFCGLDFTERWSLWITSLKSDSLQSGAEKILHEHLLRLTKGALKAYRIWRIDRYK